MLALPAMRRWVLAAGAVFVAAASPAPARAGSRREAPSSMTQHRDRRDGLVLLARARRPRRRRPAGDRRAVLQHVRLRRRRAAARQGHGDEGPRLRAARRRRPRRRRRAEIVVGGNEGTVAAYEFEGGGCSVKPGWPASTCSGGQCPEARGMAAGDLDGDGRIEVVVTTTNTSPTGSQVFVFDATGALSPGADRLASLQPRPTTTTSTASATTATALRRERRHRQPRRRPAARGRRHVRQPPDQRLQPRRHVGARVAVVHEPAERLRRAPPRLGPVHPLAEPEGRGRPLPPPHRRLAATCARRRGCSGRPRRRRSPTSTATGGTRSSASRTPS